MKKKENENFISIKHLEDIAESFKKQMSASLSSTLDEEEELSLEERLDRFWHPQDGRKPHL